MHIELNRKEAGGSKHQLLSLGLDTANKAEEAAMALREGGSVVGMEYVGRIQASMVATRKLCGSATGTEGVHRFVAKRSLKS